MGGAVVAAGAGAVPADGSGFMMLTGGIDAEVGKSALVGLPVGTVAGSTAAAAAAGLPVTADDTAPPHDAE